MMKLIEFKEDSYQGIVEYVHKINKYMKKLQECLDEGEYNTRKHHSDYSDSEDDDDDMRYKRMGGGRYSRY